MLPITLTIAGAAALLNIWLGVRTSQLRIARKVMIGDGGDPQILARMRAQANFVEYAPFVLILMALIERAGAGQTWLWIAGAAFILARIAHAIGMDRPAPNPFRAGGILVTIVVLLVLAVDAIWIPYAAMRPA